MNNPLALDLRQISKRFPGVLAVDRVDLAIRAGEVHALLGENGAGKSTLMKLVYGLHQPDAGGILVHGRPARIRSPRDAMALGIGMVHQHFMLIPAFSVIENIVLGLASAHPPLLELRRAEGRVRQLADDLGLGAPLSTRVSQLSLGQQQKVEIIKALHRGARILILDEPTAALAPQESEELFQLIERLRADGVTVVFISHKLNEVLRASQRVSVMRQGRLVSTQGVAQATPAGLATLMVGEEVALATARPPAAPGKVTLAAENLRAPGLNGLSLRLRAGEIHGLAGVDGNGQQGLVQALMGLMPLREGTVLLRGEDITHWVTAERIRAGIAHISENRQTEGLALGLSVGENLLLERFDRPPYARGIWRRFKAAARRTREMMDTFDIRAPGPETGVAALSGGNQQKVVLARALSGQPAALIATQPTRGLDVGAASFIHRQIIAARERGCAVLLISSDLDEILALSDVISVIYEGRIVETATAAKISLKRIGLLMAGSRGADDRGGN